MKPQTTEAPQRTNTFSLLLTGGMGSYGGSRWRYVCCMPHYVASQRNLTFTSLSPVTHRPRSPTNRPSCRIFSSTNILPRNHCATGSSWFRRRSSPCTAKRLQNPPTPPNRADPRSADVDILGPLDERRKVNMRRGFFKEETAKIQPPIVVFRVHIIRASASLGNPAETGAVRRTDAGCVTTDITTVLHDLESIASPNQNLPKRATNPTSNAPSTSTVNHFIRCQHQKRLEKIPIMTYFEHPDGLLGEYQASSSAPANSDLSNRLTSAVPMADETNSAWLRLPLSQEPRVDAGSPPSQEPKGKVELVMDTTAMVDQGPQVSGKLV